MVYRPRCRILYTTGQKDYELLISKIVGYRQKLFFKIKSKEDALIKGCLKIHLTLCLKFIQYVLHILLIFLKYYLYLIKSERHQYISGGFMKKNIFYLLFILIYLPQFILATENIKSFFDDVPAEIIIFYLSRDNLSAADRASFSCTSKKMAEITSTNFPVQHLNLSLAFDQGCLDNERDKFFNRCNDALQFNVPIASLQICGLDNMADSFSVGDFCKVTKDYENLIQKLYFSLKSNPLLLNNVYSLKLNEWSVFFNGRAEWEEIPNLTLRKTKKYLCESISPISDETITYLKFIISSMNNLRFLEYKSTCYPFPFVDEICNKPIQSLNFFRSDLSYESLLTIGKKINDLKLLNIRGTRVINNVHNWSISNHTYKPIGKKAIYRLKRTKVNREERYIENIPMLFFPALEYISIGNLFFKQDLGWLFEMPDALITLCINDLNSTSLRILSDIINKAPEKFRNLKKICMSSEAINRQEYSYLLNVLQEKSSTPNGLNLESFKIFTNKVDDPLFYKSLVEFLVCQTNLHTLKIRGEFISEVFGAIKRIKDQLPQLKIVEITYPEILVSPLNFYYRKIDMNDATDLERYMREIDPEVAVKLFAHKFYGLFQYMDFKNNC